MDRNTFQQYDDLAFLDRCSAARRALGSDARIERLWPLETNRRDLGRDRCAGGAGDSCAGIRDVDVVEINDMLGDHYPTHKRLCLSTDVYNTPSVAALGIAAHECGHAIQDQKGYAPLKLRMAIVPVTQFASNMLPFIFLGGLFFGLMKLALLAVGVYLVLTLFQLITLPVEFDASRRAKIILQQMGIIRPGEEAEGVNQVLDAAAMAYVAAFVASLGTLVYYLLIVFGNRER